MPRYVQVVTEKKPSAILVGESNPYGADPYFALYPAPDGCSGHRLCRLILGMRRSAYLDSFERVNLCEGSWLISQARAKARSLTSSSDLPLILLGAKVSMAFNVPFKPFCFYRRGSLLVLPHPSGLCRIWNQVDAIHRARAAVLQLCPELYEMIPTDEEVTK